MLLIDLLPSIEQLEEKMMEFEAAGDYEGQDAWFMSLYQQVFDAYRSYRKLPDDVQARIVGREKLLNLDFIWSVMPMVITDIATAVDYSDSIFRSNGQFVIYMKSGDKYYAIDGEGHAEEIWIDENGLITADVTDANMLLWTITKSGTSATICNVKTGYYLRLTRNGATNSGEYSCTMTTKNDGVELRSSSYRAYLNTSNNRFYGTTNGNNASTFYFGAIYNCTVWLDGTCGGLQSYTGSPDTAYPVSDGKFILPKEWPSPT